MKNMDEFEYYLLQEVEFPSKPSLVFTENPEEDELMIEEPVQGIDLVEMKFDGPYPKKPTMVDFHSDGVVELVSDKIYNVLNPLNIQGIQLLPATFLDPKNGTVYKNYYYLHIYHYLKCLDLEKSVYRPDRVGGVRMIDKMVLNTNILSQIPLGERLMFRLGEMFTHQIFHKSIVDKIMTINPEGLRFIKMEDFNVGSAFD